MTIDFIPTITQDGSISLYNNEVNDIYHSSVGAYTEALNKFILPSGILEYVKTNDSVRILDICFGLGYNSKTAVNEILKINPKCKINIDCLEIDKNVLIFSTLIDFKNIDYKIQKIFNAKIINSLKNYNIITNFLSDNAYKDFIDPNFLSLYKIRSKQDVKYFKTHKNIATLHNIYYKSNLNRNISSIQSMYKTIIIKPKFFTMDARETIKYLETPYDYIFHDGFTPAKLPTLWSIEFFKELYRLLKPDGNITTYSASAPVRKGLLEAGFYIACTKINGRSFGTTAYKQKNLIANELTPKHFGILETKAGIPYRDKCLNLQAEEILKVRQEEITTSSLTNSSRYLKDNKLKGNYFK